MLDENVDYTRMGVMESYMDALKEKFNGVEIERFPVKGDVFHAVEIEGQYFYGSISVDGPVVVLADRRNRYDKGFVQLGVAQICFTSKCHQDNQQEWFICKYGPAQARVPLNGLSSAGRYAVAYEFGIPIIDINLQLINGSLFYWSPAFHSLCEFAKKHPRKAKEWESNSYLGDWGEAARAGLIN